MGHRSMPLSARCENSLTAYILLDLFKLVADRRCVQRQLPRGSLWMASQTHKNLQSVCLGILSVVLSKDPEGDPWKHGHMRLAELPIEEWFGRLRSRSSTSQLTVREYYDAAAKEMVRASKKQKNHKNSGSDHSRLDPISDQEFLEISGRALKSAIRLVAWCSGLTEESLKVRYFELAGHLINPSEADPEKVHKWEQDEQDFWDAADGNGEQGPVDKCKDLLDGIKKDATVSEMDEGKVDTENGDHEQSDKPDDEQTLDPLLVDLSDLPDLEAMQEVCKTKGDPMSPFQAEPPSENNDFGTTLSEALRLCGDKFIPGDSGRDSTNSILDALWRLTMYLRYFRGGPDRHWVKNPRASTKASATTHWYRCLVRGILFGFMGDPVHTSLQNQSPHYLATWIQIL